MHQNYKKLTYLVVLYLIVIIIYYIITKFIIYTSFRQLYLRHLCCGTLSVSTSFTTYKVIYNFNISSGGIVNKLFSTRPYRHSFSRSLALFCAIVTSVWNKRPKRHSTSLGFSILLQSGPRLWRSPETISVVTTGYPALTRKPLHDL